MFKYWTCPSCDGKVDNGRDYGGLGNMNDEKIAQTKVMRGLQWWEASAPRATTME